MSKIEAGKLELESIDFDLVGLVEGTAELLVETARAKKLSVMTYVDSNLPSYMKGDPGRLRQVLLNLIGNALKFTEQGEVVIRVLADDSMNDAHDGTDGTGPSAVRCETTGGADKDGNGTGSSDSKESNIFMSNTGFKQVPISKFGSDQSGTTSSVLR